jgi:hypothetical protein
MPSICLLAPPPFSSPFAFGCLHGAGALGGDFTLTFCTAARTDPVNGGGRTDGGSKGGGAN